MGKFGAMTDHQVEVWSLKLAYRGLTFALLTVLIGGLYFYEARYSEGYEAGRFDADRKHMEVE